MKWRLIWAVLAVTGACLSQNAVTASAQGLIWNLPQEDGAWVRYEGTYTVIKTRPDADDGDLELKWARRLTIKSVGDEMATVDGKETACRWVEFRLETGRETAEGPETGRFGTRIYKVLIPANRVIGKIADEDNIPVTFLPIVKGFRQIGDRPAKPVKEKVLAIYPMISLLDHYQDFKPTSKDAEPVDVPLGAISARLFKGTQVLETPITRSTNQAELALSDEVPFGPVMWKVNVVREVKDKLSPEDAFQKVSTITIEMQAVETGGGATGDIPNTN